MFREMRRKGQLLPKEEAEAIMLRGKAGVLAVTGDDGYPYTIPLNYVYEPEAITFHCAKEGHKLDAIGKNEKVSFCVIDKDEVIPEAFTSHYASVVAFGRAREVREEGEKLRLMRLLNAKYSPGLDEAGEKEIQGAWNRLCVVRIEVEHMTGKAAKELVKGQE